VAAQHANWNLPILMHCLRLRLKLLDRTPDVPGCDQGTTGGVVCMFWARGRLHVSVGWCQARVPPVTGAALQELNDASFAAGCRVNLGHS